MNTLNINFNSTT